MDSNTEDEKKQRMKWTDDHVDAFFHEINVYEAWSMAPGTVERTEVWAMIASDESHEIGDIPLKIVCMRKILHFDKKFE